MPEYTRENENRPELGFVSLGDWLNANRGPLDAGYQQDYSQAHALGDTLQGQLGLTEQQARDYSGQSGQPAGAANVPAYDQAASSAMQAQEMGRKFADPYGRSAGGDPTSPESIFNSSLETAAHGGDYKKLSDYLTPTGQFGPDQSMAKGNRAGFNDYIFGHMPFGPITPAGPPKYSEPPSGEPMPPGSAPGKHPGGPGQYPSPPKRPGGY